MVAGHLRAAFVQRQSELVRLVEAQVVS
jgi:hypothetical protein